MPADRMQAGYKLFQDKKVHVDKLEPGDMKFFVEGTSNGKPKKFHDVLNLAGYWNCDCDDWMWRHEQNEGAFLCKHMWAVFFKLAEVKGNTEQTVLFGAVK
jgi:hypothetical protein